MLFIPFFIAINCTALAQAKQKPTTVKSTNPIAKFIGNWQGAMTWSPNNGKPPQNVEVLLSIQPIKDSVNQYTWNITYGTNKADVRPYILKKIDTIANHWVIDENNGIVLDSYMLQGRLIGAFTIGGVTLVDNYWIENNNLHFEFITFPKMAQGTTGKGTEEVPIVDVYRIGSYQKAVLKKMSVN